MNRPYSETGTLALEEPTSATTIISDLSQPVVKPAVPKKSHQVKDGILVRYELKYMLHPAQVPLVRAFIQPWCRPDSNAKNDPPSYTNMTMVLDTPERSAYMSHEVNALNRYKLRARVYATDGSSPVVLEIKRKLGNQIIKTRSQVPFNCFNLSTFMHYDESLPFANEERHQGYREFSRIVQETGAAPAMLLRYRREPWIGTIDEYSRVTLDSQLMYQPCRDWNNWGRGRTWRSFDSAEIEGGFSGVVLELKCDNKIPLWMQELIYRFDLQRRSVSKYAIAVKEERSILPEVIRDEWDL